MLLAIGDLVGLVTKKRAVFEADRSGITVH
jgi:hypothetical protein